MPQTTGAVAGVNAKVEFSANGSSWTDISGSSSVVEAPEQSGQSGETYTHSGNNAIVTAGKVEPVEVTVKTVYSETGGEAFEVVRAQWETSGRVGYLRWSPRGGTTGQFQYTTAAGVLTGFTYPASDSGDAKPIMAGFKLKVSSITKSTVA